MTTVFDPFSSDSRKAATRERMAEQVLVVLREHKEGLSGADLAHLVAGHRATLDEVLRGLWAEKRVTAAPRKGRGGGVTWKVEN